MPSPLPLSLRRQILARVQLGRLPADIAAELRLPREPFAASLTRSATGTTPP